MNSMPLPSLLILCDFGSSCLYRYVLEEILQETFHEFLCMWVFNTSIHLQYCLFK